VVALQNCCVGAVPRDQDVRFTTSPRGSSAPRLHILVAPSLFGEVIPGKAGFDVPCDSWACHRILVWPSCCAVGNRTLRLATNVLGKLTAKTSYVIMAVITAVSSFTSL